MKKEKKNSIRKIIHFPKNIGPKAFVKLGFLFIFFLVIPALSIFLIVKTPRPGIIATYYNTFNWSGQPVFVRHEDIVDLSTYRDANKRLLLPSTNFSIAWNGWIRIDDDGDYHVSTISDDGSSVLIDDELVVDNGGFHGLAEVQKEVFLTKGMHKITVYYFNGSDSYDFSFRIAKDYEKRPEQPLSPSVFFLRPLSKTTEFLTRYQGILPLGCLLSLGLGVLTWKYDRRMLESILYARPVTWVLVGFSISYLLFFVRPVFLNPVEVMQFSKYVPALSSIGADFRKMRERGEAWLIEKKSPYVIAENQKPPFATVFSSPLIFLNFPTGYNIMVLSIVACFVFMTLILPGLIAKEKWWHPVIVLCFITGVFSYNLQFELERGQTNVIAAFLCFCAIYLYHSHHRYRYVAYVLFSMSIQLKLYPAIFIVMFVRDWRDWKNNIKRVFGLGVFNVLALFILGPRIFLDFIDEVTRHIMHPQIWVGNHSIQAFVRFISETMIEKYHHEEWKWLDQYSDVVQLALLVILGFCLFLLIFQAYWQKSTGINPYLLVACTIGAALIPSVSHDCKLSILVAPMAIMLSDESFSQRAARIRWRPLFILLIGVMSFAYSTILFSYTNKPLLLGNNLPALLVILVTTTIFSLIFKSGDPQISR